MARPVLVGAAFVLAAWYLRLRSFGRPALEVASAVALALAFCASEAALCAVPFLLGSAWFGAD